MAREKKRFRRKRRQILEKCYFCTSNLRPSYKEPEVLNRFLTSRGKIMGVRSSEVFRVCSKHQRQLSKEIKRARYLALLPYIIRP